MRISCSETSALCAAMSASSASRSPRARTTSRAAAVAASCASPSPLAMSSISSRTSSIVACDTVWRSARSSSVGRRAGRVAARRASRGRARAPAPARGRRRPARASSTASARCAASSPSIRSRLSSSCSCSTIRSACRSCSLRAWSASSRAQTDELVGEEACLGIAHDRGDRRGFAGDLGLPAQRLELAPQLARQVAQPGEVGLHRVELAERLLFAPTVLEDAGGLFDEAAPLLGRWPAARCRAGPDRR